jgi:D-beta-D-heptose 7-phosphate kinase/D-beta-D-heptose 1-phosphate adenosyltransferase
MIKNFSNTKVLVIGDVMLDRYWWGDVTRISPEAPVPVVRLKKDTYVPGGAANVAMNTAGLGAATILLGVVGNDSDSAHLRDGLKSSGISTQHLTVSGERPTNVKTRVVAHNQQVVRVDREVTTPLSAAETENLIGAMSSLIRETNVVLLSDYAKGVLSSPILEAVFDLAAKAGKPVVVDPKGKDYSKYRGATILTPNRKEAAEACNLEPESDDLVNTVGRSLLHDLDLTALLITESEHGMTLFEKGHDLHHFDAVSKEVYDVTGAGDTVVATVAVALGAGTGFREAARIANVAAGVVVQHVGTAAITIDDLADAIREASAA